VDRRGKYEIFVQHYREYLPRVLNYVRLRVDEEALAQDLTALTFERALSRLSTLRDEGAFGGWLFRIAHNVVGSYYRHRRLDLPLEGAANCPHPDGSPEMQVVQSEELEALRAALALLSEREREIIRLRFFAGLTNRAIGRIMGLREGNVAVILYRALRRMRRWMQESLSDEMRAVWEAQGQS
jgi:RNA polymerase sigma-70 factor (ECF subfamily)